MEKFLLLNGVKYYLTSNKKYYYADEKVDGIRVRRSYHRTLYETYHNIKIPPKYHIHHVDGNTHNNSIENLEMILGHTHLSEHVKERWQDPEYKANGLIHLDIQREKTKVWHRSEQGRVVHSEIGKKSWESRPMYKKTCGYCSKEFETPFPTRTKLCSHNCNQNMRYKLRLDFVKRECVVCQSVFETRKNEPTKTCSQTCSVKSRVYKNKK